MAALSAASGWSTAWGEEVGKRDIYGREDSGTPVPDDLAILVDPAQVRELALKAIDAAKDAGADYADVRLTRTVNQFMYVGSSVQHGGVFESQTISVGVRALANGYWGFASSPFWRTSEMGILAKNATAQAKTNALGTRRIVELGSVPAQSGAWTMPVRFDPFTIPLEERINFTTSWIEFVNHYRQGVSQNGLQMRFQRQERALATTDGTYVTQTVYDTAGDFSIEVRSRNWRTPKSVNIPMAGLTEAGRGWELFLNAKILDQIPRLVAQADEQLALPVKPFEVNRYDIVYDAQTIASLLDATIGSATELDRALGYEANAFGTSYLSDPLHMLGTFHVGAPLLNVTANRSMPGGLATVKWDDEGVIPDVFPLIQNGVLMDFQTTREQASWLAPWYRQRNLPVRSHGCAASDSAQHITMQHRPNLALTPNTNNIGFDDLVADTQRGLAIIRGSASVDFQLRSGTGNAALVREIVRGKLGAIIAGAAYLFDSVGLWKRLVAIGGPQSTNVISGTSVKGQPFQGTSHTVSAVPAKIANVTTLDMMRRG